MSIVDNKKAFFDYFIEERYEAGLVLEGWEVKAIRAGRAQIKEAYVVVRNAEIFLIGSHISPLSSTSTHIYADPTRTRKLLLNESEIRKLIGKVEQRGYGIRKSYDPNLAFIPTGAFGLATCIKFEDFLCVKILERPSSQASHA